MPTCVKCGKNVPLTDLTGGACSSCRDRDPEEIIAEERQRERDYEAILPREMRAALQRRNIILTTETAPDGMSIDKRIEIITAECAYGINLFRDILTGVRDLVGGRSGAIQTVLRDGRRTVIQELKDQAAALGADAVVGVSLNYSQVGSGGSNMLLLAAVGTAVTLKAPMIE